ncbi:MAG: O-antigen polysaccharide polymerase Wzy [Bryobacteraceae bacterium]
MRSIALDPVLPGPVESFVMSGQISRSKAILILHIILTSIVAGAGVLFPVVQLDPERLVYPACLLVTGSFVWILWSWYALRKTLFEPYSLFVIAAGLFNAGQALLELFGMNSGGILQGEVQTDILTKALFLVAVSMLCLHTGALLALSRKSRGKPIEDSSPTRDRAARLVGWLLLAIAFVPTLNLLRGSFDLVLDYGYMGLYTHRIAALVSFALSGFLMPGTIFLLAGSKRSRWTQLFCVAFTALYAGAYLFLGSRGAAAITCVAVVWVFESGIRRIPRSLIWIFTVAAVLVFPLVRETRNISGKYRLSWESQIESLSNLENPVSSSISEMGHSLVTVTHTLALVPDIRPFDLGASYFYAATAVIPNLGWEVHPSVAHGLLSDWLTSTVDPSIFSSGGGLGFSFIAESYLNFGWFGGPLWLGFVGFCVTSLFLTADATDPAKHALVGSFLSFFFLFARGESAGVTRGLVWYAVVPYLLVTALAMRGRPRKARL